MLSPEQLEKQVLRYCRQELLLAAEEKILVACSGGTDSIALAEILYRLREEQGWRLAVCHVHHGLRGCAADRDAEQVERWARERRIPFFLRRIPVADYAAEQGLSVEDAARRLRYQALEEVLQLSASTLLATGHHKEDQAETVLMRLLRGAGPTGLAGILPRRGVVIRPLLGVRRAELSEYCRARQLVVCEDETNQDVALLRNRIRHELLPQLAAEYNPEIVEALVKTALVCQREDAYLNQLAAQAEAQVEALPDGARLPLPVLTALPPALQQRLLRTVLRKKSGADAAVTFTHLEKIAILVQRGQVGKKLPMPGGWVLEREYGALRLYRPQAAPPAPAFSWPLPVPGRLALPDGTQLLTSWCQERPRLPADATAACFSAGGLSLPLVVRSRQAGDVFRPAGGGGSKKLKKFFIDAKVPQRLRDGLPVVCDRQGIVWLPGLRAGQRAQTGGPWLLMKQVGKEDKDYAPGY